MWPTKAPDEVGLLSLFEASGRNVEEAAGLLRDLLAAYPDQPELAGEIRDLEHEGDRIAHEILSRVAERGSRADELDPVDVHALTGALDDVVDYAEEASDFLGLYRVDAPMDQAIALTDTLAAAGREVAAAIASLGDLREATPHLVEIKRLEHEGDRLLREGLTALFEGGVDPMVVIRGKDIYERVEEGIDACDRVAHVLRGIAVKTT